MDPICGGKDSEPGVPESDSYIAFMSSRSAGKVPGFNKPNASSRRWQCPEKFEGSSFLKALYKCVVSRSIHLPPGIKAYRSLMRGV